MILKFGLKHVKPLRQFHLAPETEATRSGKRFTDFDASRRGASPLVAEHDAPLPSERELAYRSVACRGSLRLRTLVSALLLLTAIAALVAILAATVKPESSSEPMPSAPLA